METDVKEKGFLTKLWQAHGKFVKTMSFGGALLTVCFLPTAAVAAQADSPDAGLFDVAGHFYGAAATNAVNNFVPGYSFMFEQVAGVFLDTIMPGVGTVIGGVSHAIQDV